MKISLFILTALIAVFCAYPELDIIVSGLFHNDSKGFIYKDNLLVQVIYYSARVLTTLILGACLYVFFYEFLKKKGWLQNIYPQFLAKIRDILNIKTNFATFMLAVIIITPGILVHSIMKPLWERARPINIEEFTWDRDFFPQTKNFTPIYKIMTGENGNSFPSGHAAMGAAMIGLIFMFSGRRRKQALLATISYAILVSFGRIVQGGHFLSDVSISATLTIITILLCKKYILDKNSEQDQ